MKTHQSPLSATNDPITRPGFARQVFSIITGRWSRVVLTVAFVEGATGFGVLAVGVYFSMALSQRESKMLFN